MPEVTNMEKELLGIELDKRGTAPNLLSIIEELKTSNRLNQRMVELVVHLGESAFSTLRDINSYNNIIKPLAQSVFFDSLFSSDCGNAQKYFKRKTGFSDINDLIIISSFNRVNYYRQVSFESFKESGNIEYTADVVWALQMYVANLIKDSAGFSTRKKFDDAINYNAVDFGSPLPDEQSQISDVFKFILLISPLLFFLCDKNFNLSSFYHFLL